MKLSYGLPLFSSMVCLLSCEMELHHPILALRDATELELITDEEVNRDKEAPFYGEELAQ
ncbi:MAG: hypothetical protein U9R60_17275 [Bacteroidota bacterium]|nr:hypothetical protein [Bacteroidota bacterium]